MKKLILSISLLVSVPTLANAACQCLCVDGQVRPVCDYDYEKYAVICAPKVCMN